MFNTNCYGNENIPSYTQSVENPWAAHTTHNSQGLFHQHPAAGNANAFVGYSLGQVQSKELDLAGVVGMKETVATATPAATNAWHHSHRMRYSSATANRGFLPYQMPSLPHYDSQTVDTSHLSHSTHQPFWMPPTNPNAYSLMGTSYQRDHNTAYVDRGNTSRSTATALRHNTAMSNRNYAVEDQSRTVNASLQQQSTQVLSQHCQRQSRQQIHQLQQHQHQQLQQQQDYLRNQMTQRERDPCQYTSNTYHQESMRVGMDTLYHDQHLISTAQHQHQHQQYQASQEALRKASETERRTAFTSRQTCFPQTWAKPTYVPFDTSQAFLTNHRSSGSAFQPCNKQVDSDPYSMDSIWAKSAVPTPASHVPHTPNHSTIPSTNNHMPLTTQTWLHDSASHLKSNMYHQPQEVKQATNVPSNFSANMLNLDTGQVELSMSMVPHELPVYPQTVPQTRQRATPACPEPTPIQPPHRSLPIPAVPVSQPKPQPAESKQPHPVKADQHARPTATARAAGLDVRQFLATWDEDIDLSTPRPACVEVDEPEPDEQPHPTSLVVLDCQNVPSEQAAGLLHMYPGLQESVVLLDNSLSSASANNKHNLDFLLSRTIPTSNTGNTMSSDCRKDETACASIRNSLSSNYRRNETAWCNAGSTLSSEYSKNETACGNTQSAASDYRKDETTCRSAGSTLSSDYRKYETACSSAGNTLSSNYRKNETACNSAGNTSNFRKVEIACGSTQNTLSDYRRNETACSSTENASSSDYRKNQTTCTSTENTLSSVYRKGDTDCGSTPNAISDYRKHEPTGSSAGNTSSSDHRKDETIGSSAEKTSSSDFRKHETTGSSAGNTSSSDHGKDETIGSSAGNTSSSDCRKGEASCGSTQNTLSDYEKDKATRGSTANTFSSDYRQDEAVCGSTLNALSDYNKDERAVNALSPYYRKDETAVCSAGNTMLSDHKKDETRCGSAENTLSFDNKDDTSCDKRANGSPTAINIVVSPAVETVSAVQSDVSPAVEKEPEASPCPDVNRSTNAELLMDAFSQPCSQEATTPASLCESDSEKSRKSSLRYFRKRKAVSAESDASESQCSEAADEVTAKSMKHSETDVQHSSVSSLFGNDSMDTIDGPVRTPISVTSATCDLSNSTEHSPMECEERSVRDSRNVTTPQAQSVPPTNFENMSSVDSTCAAIESSNQVRERCKTSMPDLSEIEPFDSANVNVESRASDILVNSPSAHPVADDVTPLASENEKDDISSAVAFPSKIGESSDGNEKPETKYLSRIVRSAPGKIPKILLSRLKDARGKTRRRNGVVKKLPSIRLTRVRQTTISQSGDELPEYVCSEKEDSQNRGEDEMSDSDSQSTIENLEDAKSISTKPQKPSVIVYTSPGSTNVVKINGSLEGDLDVDGTQYEDGSPRTDDPIDLSLHDSSTKTDFVGNLPTSCDTAFDNTKLQAPVSHEVRTELENNENGAKSDKMADRVSERRRTTDAITTVSPNYASGDRREQEISRESLAPENVKSSSSHGIHSLTYDQSKAQFDCLRSFSNVSDSHGGTKTHRLLSEAEAKYTGLDQPEEGESTNGSILNLSPRVSVVTNLAERLPKAPCLTQALETVPVALREGDCESRLAESNEHKSSTQVCSEEKILSSASSCFLFSDINRKKMRGDLSQVSATSVLNAGGENTAPFDVPAEISSEETHTELSDKRQSNKTLDDADVRDRPFHMPAVNSSINEAKKRWCSTLSCARSNLVSSPNIDVNESKRSCENIACSDDCQFPEKSDLRSQADNGDRVDDDDAKNELKSTEKMHEAKMSSPGRDVTPEERSLLPSQQDQTVGGENTDSSSCESDSRDSTDKSSVCSSDESSKESSSEAESATESGASSDESESASDEETDQSGSTADSAEDTETDRDDTQAKTSDAAAEGDGGVIDTQSEAVSRLNEADSNNVTNEGHVMETQSEAVSCRDQVDSDNETAKVTEDAGNSDLPEHVGTPVQDEDVDMPEVRSSDMKESARTTPVHESLDQQSKEGRHSMNNVPAINGDTVSDSSKVENCQGGDTNFQELCLEPSEMISDNINASPVRISAENNAFETSYTEEMRDETSRIEAQDEVPMTDELKNGSNVEMRDVVSVAAPPRHNVSDLINGESNGFCGPEPCSITSAVVVPLEVTSTDGFKSPKADFLDKPSSPNASREVPDYNTSASGEEGGCSCEGVNGTSIVRSPNHLSCPAVSPVSASVTEGLQGKSLKSGNDVRTSQTVDDVCPLLNPIALSPVPQTPDSDVGIPLQDKSSAADDTRSEKLCEKTDSPQVADPDHVEEVASHVVAEEETLVMYTEGSPCLEVGENVSIGPEIDEVRCPQEEGVHVSGGSQYSHVSEEGDEEDSDYQEEQNNQERDADGDLVQEDDDREFSGDLNFGAEFTQETINEEFCGKILGDQCCDEGNDEALQQQNVGDEEKTPERTGINWSAEDETSIEEGNEFGHDVPGKIVPQNCLSKIVSDPGHGDENTYHIYTQNEKGDYLQDVFANCTGSVGSVHLDDVAEPLQGECIELVEFQFDGVCDENVAVYCTDTVESDAVEGCANEGVIHVCEVIEQEEKVRSPNELGLENELECQVNSEHQLYYCDEETYRIATSEAANEESQVSCDVGREEICEQWADVESHDAVPVPAESVENWPYVEEILGDARTISQWSPEKIESPPPLEMKCSLSWDRILNEGQGLVLGPANVEVRLPGHSSRGRTHWKVVTRERRRRSFASRKASSCLEENNNLMPDVKSPIVVVKRLVLKRPRTRRSQRTMKRSEQDSSAKEDCEKEDSDFVYPGINQLSPLKTKGALKSYQTQTKTDSNQTSLCRRTRNRSWPSTTKDLPVRTLKSETAFKRRKSDVYPPVTLDCNGLSPQRLPKVIIKRTGEGPLYQSFICEKDRVVMQPVVCIERNLELDHLAMNMSSEGASPVVSECGQSPVENDFTKNEAEISVVDKSNKLSTVHEPERRSRRKPAKVRRVGQLMKVVELLQQWRQAEQDAASRTSQSEQILQPECDKLENNNSLLCVDNNTDDENHELHLLQPLKYLAAIEDRCATPVELSENNSNLHSRPQSPAESFTKLSSKDISCDMDFSADNAFSEGEYNILQSDSICLEKSECSPVLVDPSEDSDSSPCRSRSASIGEDTHSPLLFQECDDDSTQPEDQGEQFETFPGDAPREMHESDQIEPCEIHPVHQTEHIKTNPGDQAEDSETYPGDQAEDFEMQQGDQTEHIEARPGDQAEDFETHPVDQADDFEMHPGDQTGHVEACSGNQAEDSETHPGDQAEDFETQPGDQADDFETHPGDQAEDFEMHSGDQTEDFEARPGDEAEDFETRPGDKAEDFETRPGDEAEDSETHRRDQAEDFEMQPEDQTEHIEAHPGDQAEDSEMRPADQAEDCKMLSVDLTEHVEVPPGDQAEDSRTHAGDQAENFEMDPGDMTEHVDAHPGDQAKDSETRPEDQMEHIKAHPEDQAEDFEAHPEEQAEHVKAQSGDPTADFEMHTEESKHSEKQSGDPAELIEAQPDDQAEHIEAQPVDQAEHIEAQRANPADDSEVHLGDHAEHIEMHSEDQAEHIDAHQGDQAVNLQVHPGDQADYTDAHPGDQAKGFELHRGDQTENSETHPYHCQRCQVAFESQDDFKEHLAAEHPSTKEHHHCLLCQRTFPSAERHAEHRKGWQHCFMERTQRHTIHSLYRLFTGSDCPYLPSLETEELQSLDWLPSDPGVIHFYHDAPPLQLAIQDCNQNVSRGANENREASS